MQHNNIQIVCDLVKCLSGVETLLVAADDRKIASTLEQKLYGVISSDHVKQLVVNSFRSMRSGCVYEIQAVLNINYLIIYDESAPCYLIVGPCISRRLSRAEARAQLRSRNLEQALIEKILASYEEQPLLPYEKYHQLGTLMAQFIQGSNLPVPYQRIDYHWNTQEQKAFLLVDQYTEITQMRQIELRYEYSTAMTEAVRRGNLSLAYQYLQRMNAEKGSMLRRQDSLREMQNLCIVLNTQLRHALESSGIHPYLLDKVSRQIAAHIEKLRTAEDTEQYIVDVIRQYCELVQENAFSHLKPTAKLAVMYIKNHLSDNLTVKSTADALLINANYLSDQFHREVGLTFIDFLNRERCTQAASLLKYTNLQIQQIATAVGYNNTSYFAKQFAKIFSMTPRDFRQNGVI